MKFLNNFSSSFNYFQFLYYNHLPLLSLMMYLKESFRKTVPGNIEHFGRRPQTLEGISLEKVN